MDHMVSSMKDMVQSLGSLMGDSSSECDIIVKGVDHDGLHDERGVERHEARSRPRHHVGQAHRLPTRGHRHGDHDHDHDDDDDDNDDNDDQLYFLEHVDGGEGSTTPLSESLRFGRLTGRRSSVSADRRRLSVGSRQGQGHARRALEKMTASATDVGRIGRRGSRRQAAPRVMVEKEDGDGGGGASHTELEASFEPISSRRLSASDGLSSSLTSSTSFAKADSLRRELRGAHRGYSDLKSMHGQYAQTAESKLHKYKVAVLVLKDTVEALVKEKAELRDGLVAVAQQLQAANEGENVQVQKAKAASTATTQKALTERRRMLELLKKQKGETKKAVKESQELKERVEELEDEVDHLADLAEQSQRARRCAARATFERGDVHRDTLVALDKWYHTSIVSVQADSVQVRAACEAQLREIQHEIALVAEKSAREYANKVAALKTKMDRELDAERDLRKAAQERAETLQRAAVAACKRVHTMRVNSTAVMGAVESARVEWDKKLEHVRAAHSRIATERDELRDEIRNVRGGLHAAVQTRENVGREAQAVIADLERQLADTVGALEDVTGDREELTEELDELRQVLGRTVDDLSQKQRELKEAEATSREHVMQLREKNARVATLLVEERGHNEQLAASENVIRASMRDLEGRWERADGVATVLMARAKGAESQVDELKRSVDTLQKERKVLETQWRNEVETIAQDKEECGKQHKAEVIKLQRHLQESKSMGKALDKDLRDLRTELEELMDAKVEEVTELKRNVALAEQREQLLSTDQADARDALEREIEIRRKLEDDVARLQGLREKSLENVRILEEALREKSTDMIRDVSEANKRIVVHECRIADLEKNLERSRLRTDELEQEVTAKDERLVLLENMTHNENATLERYRVEMEAKFKKQLLETDALLQQAHVEATAAYTKLELEAEHRENALSGTVADLKERLVQKDKTNALHVDELKGLRSRAREEAERIRDLQRTLFEQDVEVKNVTRLRDELKALSLKRTQEGADAATIRAALEAEVDRLRGAMKGNVEQMQAERLKVRTAMHRAAKAEQSYEKLENRATQESDERMAGLHDELTRALNERQEMKAALRDAEKARIVVAEESKRAVAAKEDELCSVLETVGRERDAYKVECTRLTNVAQLSASRAQSLESSVAVMRSAIDQCRAGLIAPAQLGVSMGDANLALSTIHGDPSTAQDIMAVKNIRASSPQHIPLGMSALDVSGALPDDVVDLAGEDTVTSERGDDVKPRRPSDVPVPSLLPQLLSSIQNDVDTSSGNNGVPKHPSLAAMHRRASREQGRNAGTSAASLLLSSLTTSPRRERNSVVPRVPLTEVATVKSYFEDVHRITAGEISAHKGHRGSGASRAHGRRQVAGGRGAIHGGGGNAGNNISSLLAQMRSLKTRGGV